MIYFFILIHKWITVDTLKVHIHGIIFKIRIFELFIELSNYLLFKFFSMNVNKKFMLGKKLKKLYTRFYIRFSYMNYKRNLSIVLQKYFLRVPEVKTLMKLYIHALNNNFKMIVIK